LGHSTLGHFHSSISAIYEGDGFWSFPLNSELIQIPAAAFQTRAQLDPSDGNPITNPSQEGPNTTEACGLRGVDALATVGWQPSSGFPERIALESEGLEFVE
jgi:hypothetical protein